MRTGFTDGSEIGWLVEDGSGARKHAAMLTVEGDVVTLSIALGGMFDTSDPITRWFTPGHSYSDDPDQTRFRYSPPDTLGFVSVEGLTVLLGCRLETATLGVSGGVGRVRAMGAVRGASNLKFDKVNGVRSRIPALLSWAETRSVETRFDFENDYGVRNAHISARTVKPIRVSRRKNLTMAPSWRQSADEKLGQIVVDDMVRLETRTERPAPLNEHLDLHDAIRRLVSIAAGTDLGFAEITVNRDDDSTQFGDTIEPNWLAYSSEQRPSHQTDRGDPLFAFRFSDIGAKGIDKWLSLSRSFHRGIDPAIALITGPQIAIESQMVLVGIAIEALGYRINERDQLGHSNPYGSVNFPTAVHLVLDGLGEPILRDQQTWVSNVIACYSGVKHADNAKPELELLVDTVQQAKLVLRTWVGHEIGCPVSHMIRALQRTSHRYLMPIELAQN